MLIRHVGDCFVGRPVGFSRTFAWLDPFYTKSFRLFARKVLLSIFLTEKEDKLWQPLLPLPHCQELTHRIVVANQYYVHIVVSPSNVTHVLFLEYT